MIRRFFIKPIIEFIRHEQSSGILLLLCTIAALALANSPLQERFLNFWEIKIGVDFEGFTLKESLLHWINDGLMAVFFLMVGLEIKREIVMGELSTLKKSLFPVTAALGGMAVPAAVYLFFNYNTETARGWGIPMATDIAFALAILSMVGKNAPLSLKIFLTALAIIDDIGAILVIAFFYSREFQMEYIALMGVTVALLAALNIFNVKKLPVYLVLGLFLWYFVFKSGIHATIAGVLLAFTIPLAPGAAKDLRLSPLNRLSDFLHEPVNYIVMPLFALANTGIIIAANFFENYFTGISLGILFGLAVGKPLGIISFAYIAVKLKVASLPMALTWKQLTGTGFLAGIGFTMSIFISLLAFEQETFQATAKISVLTASMISGIIGYLLLRRACNSEQVQA